MQGVRGAANRVENKVITQLLGNTNVLYQDVIIHSVITRRNLLEISVKKAKVERP